MTCEVEERIHKALAPHPLERTEDGYCLKHPGGAGVSRLRIRPVAAPAPESTLVATVDVIAEYAPLGLPSFHAAGIERLNAMAVYGAYQLVEGRLTQRAQFSLYSVDATPHLSTQMILDVFGRQLPIGRSVAAAIVSASATEQQRALHGLPGDWSERLPEEQLRTTAEALRARGIAAASDANSIWAEFALSGDVPSRTIDPKAETALLQLHAGMLHPVAGAGYLATIMLPFATRPADPVAVCGRLNAAEFDLLDFVPRMGAWGLHGPNDLPGYSCFIPCGKPYGAMHSALMWGCVQRASWIRQRHWAAGEGVVFGEAAA